MKKSLTIVVMLALTCLAFGDKGTAPGRSNGDVPGWQMFPDGTGGIIHRGLRTGVDSEGEYRYIAEEDVVFDTLVLLWNENPGLLAGFQEYVSLLSSMA